MSERYHYRLSGLDYVYLVNGFAWHETEYGPGIAIDDLDHLHEAIARHVVTSPSRLRGQEVRFLRSILNVSQAALVMPVIAFDGESWISPLRIRDRGTVHGQERD
ncbi:MAG: hypothetical protein FD149_2832, partial [Rhodospirillaceae bacterium]